MAAVVGVWQAHRIWAPAGRPLRAAVSTALERSLVERAEVALAGRREGFSALASALVDGQLAGVVSVRLLSRRGNEILSVPTPESIGDEAPPFDPTREATATRTIEVPGGGVVELGVVRTTGAGRARGLVGALGDFGDAIPAAAIALAIVLLWLRLGVVGPLETINRRVSALGTDRGTEILGVVGPREVMELAQSMVRVESRLSLCQRDSQANYVAMERSFEKLRDVLDSLGQGVLVCDPDGSLVIANHEARSTFGIEVDRLRTVRVVDCIPGRDRARVRAAIERASLEEQTVVLADIQVGHRIFNLSLAPVSESWTAVTASLSTTREMHARGVALVFLDLTAMHELNRMKDEFLSSVSHELRTPLTSIRSFTEILLQMTPRDEATWKEFLEIVNTESERLTRLVDDVLDLAKMESGALELRSSSISVEQIAAQTVAMFEPLLREKRVALDLRIAQDLPLVPADPDRLQQVVTNLLGNAAKFVPDRGGVRVVAELDDGKVRLSVEDSGVGVPESQREVVFQKFRQVAAPRAGKPKGTGLGLAISRELIESMGGRIWCEASTELGGAKFCFELPVAGRVPA